MCFLHRFLSKPRESVVLLPIEQERSGHARRWTRFATVSVCLGAMGDFAVCSTACRTPENAQNPELPDRCYAVGLRSAGRAPCQQGSVRMALLQTRHRYAGKIKSLSCTSTGKLSRKRYLLAWLQYLQAAVRNSSHAGEVWHCVGHTWAKKGATFWKVLAGL